MLAVLLIEVNMMILVSFIDSKPITKFCVGCPPIYELISAPLYLK